MSNAQHLLNSISPYNGELLDSFEELTPAEVAEQLNLAGHGYVSRKGYCCLE